MSLISFDNYGRLAATSEALDTEVAGRYSFQAEAERRIVPDLLKKLDISSTDSLLEIGCGPGNLLIPMSHLVQHACGIDNADSLQRLVRRCGDAQQIQTLAGNFLYMDIAPKVFSKVLIYSVVQYLESTEAALAFVQKAMGFLAPGGRLLVGDLPNRDKKIRWAESKAGKAFAAVWQQQVANAGSHPLEMQPVDTQMALIDDAFILRVLGVARAAGYEAYVLPQTPDLPFGMTREDVLIVSPQ